MNVQFFLRERTKFIRHYYRTAAQPFQSAMSAIQDGAPPYDNPPFDDSGEPPFLEDWIEAKTALEVLGRSCVSMLSGSFDLYLKRWEEMRNISWKGNERRKVLRKKGIRGYLAAIAKIVPMDLNTCEADLDIVEQVTLARNRDQHPDDIFTMQVCHSDSDLEKFPLPFFADDVEMRIFADEVEMRVNKGLDDTSIFWFNPSVQVSPERFEVAVHTVEKFAEWLEPRTR